MVPYELMDHTADLRIRVTAETLEDLFAEAGKAVFNLLLRSTRQPGIEKRRVEMEGLDLEDLMVNWLRELLYFFNGQGKAAASITILSLNNTLIRATVELYDVDYLRDEVLTDIKAVTYHQIEVGRLNEGYVTQVIFDV